jgi:hypothetical protein
MADKKGVVKSVKDTVQSVTNAVANATIAGDSQSSESQPNLVRDDETGEMVSKTERLSLSISPFSALLTSHYS